ncbi:LRR receptor-like kinase family protein, partial [Trifolium pratense]
MSLSSLFSFSSLTIINLEDNQLPSEIPGKLGGLFQLQTLRLGFNSFAGKLSNNFLSGSIPLTLFTGTLSLISIPLTHCTLRWDKQVVLYR